MHKKPEPVTDVVDVAVYIYLAQKPDLTMVLLYPLHPIQAKFLKKIQIWEGRKKVTLNRFP